MLGMLIQYPMWPDSKAGQCGSRKVALTSRNVRSAPRQCPLAAGHTSAGPRGHRAGWDPALLLWLSGLGGRATRVRCWTSRDWRFPFPMTRCKHKQPCQRPSTHSTSHTPLNLPQRSSAAVGRGGRRLLPEGIMVLHKVRQKGAGQTDNGVGDEPLFLHQDPRR